MVMPTLSSLTSVSMVTERCLPLFHSVGVQVRAADCARVLNRLRQLGWTPGYSSVGIGQADVDVEELVRLCCCALIRELLEAAGGGSGKRDLSKGLDLKYLAMAANCLRCVGPLCGGLAADDATSRPGRCTLARAMHARARHACTRARGRTEARS